MVSDTEIALAIYTETHSSFAGMQKNRKGFQGIQPTQIEIVDALRV